MDHPITFSHDPGSAERNTNEIMTAIAKEVLREPWKVVLKVRFVLDVQVSQGKPGEAMLQMILSGPGVTGDTRYRLFDIADVLLPSKVSITIRVTNRADPSMSREITVDRPLAGNSDTTGRGDYRLLFDPMTDTLVVQSAGMSFDEDARNRFFARLAEINDYYACRALLDTLNRLAEQTDIQTAGALPWNYIRVREISHAIRLIEKKDFPGNLLSGGFDPLSLVNLLTATDKRSRSLAFTFRDVLYASGAISFNGFADSLCEYFIQRVLVYITLSHRMSVINGEIYSAWLDHYFDFSVFENETDLLMLLARKIYPDANHDTIPAFLSLRLFSSYQRLADLQMKNGAFAEAFDLMDHASRFTGMNPYFPKEKMEIGTISAAARGIFNSYVGIAGTCIAGGKFAMADNYLQKADDYRKMHFYFNLSDSLYNIVFSDLFFRRNSECDQLLDAASFDIALSCYRFLENTYDSNRLSAIRSGLEGKKRRARIGIFREVSGSITSALKESSSDSVLFYFEKAAALQKDLEGVKEVESVIDSLAPFVARIKVERLTRSACAAVSRREFTLAMKEFGEAAAIAGANNFLVDSVSDSLYRVAVKQNLLITLSSQQRFIWTNSFDSAMLALNRGKRMAAAFGLSEDPDVLIAFSRYMDRIAGQRCSNLSDTILVQVIRADRSRAMKNYLRSVMILQQALKTAAKNPQCPFPVQNLRDSVMKYEKPAIYQQKIEEINHSLSAGDYDKVVSIFSENDKFFELNMLERFGLPRGNMYDFAVTRGNPYLTAKILLYFSGKSEYGEAIRSLLLLRSQGFPERSAGEMMVQLGKRMAAGDLRSNPGKDPELMAENYTGKDPWFSPFRSSYVAEWRRMLEAMGPIR